MHGGNDRAPRVAALIKRELADLLRDKVRDPRVAGVLVSDVELSRDLAHAKVYLLSAGDAGDDVMAGLVSACGFLRVALAERLRLRVVPTLQFVDDDTQRRSGRIEQLLAEEKRRP